MVLEVLLAGYRRHEGEDGLYVASCGAGKRTFVVDAGAGGGRNLTRMGYPVGRVDGVFITHFPARASDRNGTLANHVGTLLSVF